MPTDPTNYNKILLKSAGEPRIREAKPSTTVYPGVVVYETSAGVFAPNQTANQIREFAIFLERITDDPDSTISGLPATLSAVTINRALTTADEGKVYFVQPGDEFWGMIAASTNGTLGLELAVNAAGVFTSAGSGHIVVAKVAEAYNNGSGGDIARIKVRAVYPYVKA